jgi:hypothetical protein
MRRIKPVVMVVAAMALMMVATAAPAMADVVFHNGHNHDFFGFNDNNDFFFPNNGNFVANDVSNESESGDVDVSFSVQSSGNNANQCVTPLQFGNTGNFQNAQGFLQFDSFADDLEGEGGEFTFAPELSGGCTQSVEQSSAASSG